MADRDRVRIELFEDQHRLWAGEATLPLEIGRQEESGRPPLELQADRQPVRLVIAPLVARQVPRRAVRVEAVDTAAGRLQVANVHSRIAVTIAGRDEPLGPGESFVTDSAVRIGFPEQREVWIGGIDTTADLKATSGSTSSLLGAPRDARFQTIDLTLDGPAAAPAKLRQLIDGDQDDQRGRAVVDLVRAALTVVRCAAGSDLFFEAAVKAAAEMIDLDRVLALLLADGEWTVRASYHGEPGTPPGGGEAVYSRHLLDCVLDAKGTVIYDPNVLNTPSGSSLATIERAVAAPIFDETGTRVIGALYGDRRWGGPSAAEPIGELEAALLDVLAGAVSSGIARQREEHRRVSLTQFFSPRVAERLSEDQRLLIGQDAEVTVLFCDIRGFSGVAERVGPERTIEWINDVLTELSECVLRHDGVLVDYVGDELMAMWGAPGEQPDHADRACRAAAEMLSRVPVLKQRWQDVTPDGFGCGIGINTGTARVGNTGSRIKFKYGPLGTVVNVASRVQGVTKQAGVPAIVTRSTARTLPPGFEVRRIAKVQLVGIREPFDLFELSPDPAGKWRVMRDAYEHALGAFESGDLSEAASLLAALVHEHPDDYPSLILLGRVVKGLTDRDSGRDSVWRLTSK